MNNINLQATPNLEVYTVTQIAGNQLPGLRDTNGTSTRFNNPSFVVIDLTDSYLYISDVTNFRIRRLALKDPLFSVVTYATFTSEVNGIALDSTAQNLYVVATATNGIWKVPILNAGAYPSPSQGWTMVVANPSPGDQLVDGPLSSAKFFKPSAVAIDQYNNLYVIDNWQRSTVLSGNIVLYTQISIRRVSTQSSFVTTLAGKLCRVTYSGTNYDPSDVCTQSSGVLGHYVNGNGTTTGLSKYIYRNVGGYIAAGKIYIL